MRRILYYCAAASAVTTTICVTLLLFVLWSEHAYQRGYEIGYAECLAE